MSEYLAADVVDFVHPVSDGLAAKKAVDALFESVRTLAALQQETAHTAWLHARNAGHEQLARRLAGIEGRIAAVIAEELTWPEDKEVVDAFGEAG